MYGQYRIRRDWSYCHTRFWGRGAVLVGDAACFIDPVFSSGVHLATYGALLAARSINSCLRGLIDEAKSFEEFELRYRLLDSHPALRLQPTRRRSASRRSDLSFVMENEWIRNALAQFKRRELRPALEPSRKK